MGESENSHSENANQARENSLPSVRKSSQSGTTSRKRIYSCMLHGTVHGTERSRMYWIVFRYQHDYPSPSIVNSRDISLLQTTFLALYT